MRLGKCSRTVRFQKDLNFNATPLDKFIGLLGMHDHAFRQLEFLRLKRGLERGDTALFNGRSNPKVVAKDCTYLNDRSILQTFSSLPHVSHQNIRDWVSYLEPERSSSRHARCWRNRHRRCCLWMNESPLNSDMRFTSRLLGKCRRGRSIPLFSA